MHREIKKTTFTNPLPSLKSTTQVNSTYSTFQAAFMKYSYMAPPEKVYFMYCSILWTMKGEEYNKNKENGYVAVCNQCARLIGNCT